MMCLLFATMYIFVSELLQQNVDHTSTISMCFIQSSCYLARNHEPPADQLVVPSGFSHNNAARTTA